MLPAALSTALETCLREAGDPDPIDKVQHVGGGDINQAACITTSQARYFVKWHNAPPPRFFECEALGLRLLAGPGTVRVPGVIGYGDVPGSRTTFLILNWIERGSSKHGKAAEQLGREFAELHLIRQERYGLDHDNYIGRMPQSNTPSDSWVDFYRDQRLGAQRELARQHGRLPAPREKRLNQLMDSLDQWIDESICQPSILHGDLWGGNWMVDSRGQPYLIDPAAYVGDREADLAMTALFGGFPQSFYDAYHEVFPLAPGYAERQPLYKLYHLLNHLNLFGGGYGGSVDGILKQYTR
jgi:fructosamine-3-kinase